MSRDAPPPEGHAPRPIDELLTYLDGLGWDHLYVSREAVERATASSAPRGSSRSADRPDARRPARSTAHRPATGRPAAGRPAADRSTAPPPAGAAKPPAPTASPQAAGQPQTGDDGTVSSGTVSGPQPGLFAAPDSESAAALSPDERAAELESVCETAQGCVACRLASGRNRVVFGSGDPHADLMFIGEGPGADEDRQGLPFVGAAGQLLTKIIAAIDRTRDEVYICNMVKCRPPNNRDPAADELAACRGYLERQIDLVRPRVIVALGRVAAQALLDTTTSLGRLRGRWHLVRGVETRVTYHPAALLRFASYKRPTWEDMKIVRDRLASLPPRDA